MRIKVNEKWINLRDDIVEALCGRYACEEEELPDKMIGKTPHDLAKAVVGWHLGDEGWFNTIKGWGINVGAIKQADDAFERIEDARL